MQTFLDQHVKEQVYFSLEFALVMEFIFNGERVKNQRSHLKIDLKMTEGIPC